MSLLTPLATVNGWVWSFDYVYNDDLSLQHTAVPRNTLLHNAINNFIPKLSAQINWILATGWRRPIGCLIVIGHFLEKSPIIGGSLAENDLQLQTSSARPYESCKIFMGRPRQNVFSNLVHRQYKSFSTEIFLLSGKRWVINPVTHNLVRMIRF